MLIETPRLRLRSLIDADIEPLIEMLIDPEVMRHVSPTPVPRESAEAAAMHYRRLREANGYGWWAIERNGGPLFAGIILLQQVKFTAAFTPAVEVGWLLPRAHWGHGYATEGGRAALDYAFETVKLDEVVALTATGNVPSQRVMRRLGMTHDAVDDFEHPHVADKALARCVLYRIRRPSPYNKSTDSGVVWKR